MKTSAKVTAISLLASWSLGVAIFSACTVNSTTTHDTDGGVTTVPSDSTSGGTSGTGNPPVDSGGGGGSCAGDKGGTPVLSAKCQTCLDQKCCSQVTACSGINVGDGGITCADYADCIRQCNGNGSCEDNCDTATADSGVVEAYDKLATCSDGPENVDAGPNPIAAADNCVDECGGQ